MPTTVNTPFRSDYGFKSPSFTVDAAGLVIETKAGSTSGSGSILNGVTTT